jgi:hypothetical protein
MDEAYLRVSDMGTDSIKLSSQNIGHTAKFHKAIRIHISPKSVVSYLIP